MVNPESTGQSDNTDRVRETAEEQGIFNPFMGQAFEDGHWQENMASDEPVAPARRRPSRRGGRSHPEKSGRDVAREIDNATSFELDEEQRAKNATGAAAARAALRQSSEPTSAAILRAREERKQRQR